MTVEGIDVPDRTMAEKPFPANVTLRNDGPARSVYLFAAIYREQQGTGPCGPASDPRFGSFTHLVQETVRLPAQSTIVYPDEDDEWLHRYRTEHVDPAPAVAEFCVFVANATSGPALEFESFATTELSVRGVNAKPSADFTWEPEKPGATQDVRFRAQGSDADGDPVSFAWDFGHVNASGRARALGEAATTFFYPAREFVVTLIASDGLEDTSLTRTITVLEEEPPTPTQKGPLGIPMGGALALGALALASFRWRR